MFDWYDAAVVEGTSGPNTQSTAWVPAIASGDEYPTIQISSDGDFATDVEDNRDGATNSASLPRQFSNLSEVP